jgi:hypothetical protein
MLHLGFWLYSVFFRFWTRCRAWSGDFRTGNTEISASIPLPQHHTNQPRSKLVVDKSTSLGLFNSSYVWPHRWAQSATPNTYSGTSIIRHAAARHILLYDIFGWSQRNSIRDCSKIYSVVRHSVIRHIQLCDLDFQSARIRFSHSYVIYSPPREWTQKLQPK